ncbi:PTS mannose/fructose/sorbose/N-acetylgalactosamine transporter subunit IIC [Tetragenococcus halophilus]|uniref:PTS mannose/fructose/sorbose/N-acetylgalactosamine transporter subunit IIC n=1 Tax=Tetragenococcus halophilus TaxID=51669 RepID=UPI0015BFF032|nr:PTS sugar transporter subunit IIC [Tetragenococcus halophilus]MCO8292566.1 PTS sugar transporter subunit IIC [Tetragenococcus halophilus]NWN99643.1 PTS sugar transporter subunit IIC [Tetragenococcus halophilus]
MIVQSLLVAAWAGFCSLDQFGPHLGFRKPLLAGVVVGIILGEPTQGLIISGTLELMWLGTNNVGAYQPPDVISGAIVGVAIGILSGGGEAAGVAVAIPVALLVQQLSMVIMTSNVTLVHRADKMIQNGEFGKIDKLQYLGGVLFFLSRALPVFIAIFLGAPAIERILSVIPDFIMNGLTVASEIIPAVGLAMLLSMMMKKNMWIFLVLGFGLATFLELPTIAIAMFALCAAALYDILMNRGGSDNNNSDDDNSKVNVADDEGGYDL